MKRSIIIITIVIMTAVAAGAVWAGPGRGWNRGQGQGYGQGQGCPNCGVYANLSDAQKEQLEAENKAFFEATQDLRQEMRAKRLELKSVMARKEIDADQAKKLQAEISQMRSDLGQKRIDHIINLRKIDPNLGNRFQGQKMRGRNQGPQQGRAMGGANWGRGRGMDRGNYPMGPTGRGYGNFQGPRGGWNY